MTVFEYLILINVDFYNFSFLLFPQFKVRLRGHIKHPRQCLTTFPTPQSSSKITTRRIFHSLLGVWKCGQTRSYPKNGNTKLMIISMLLYSP